MQFAEKYGISERTARNYCANGKIDGAFLVGKTWNIPADAAMPQRGAVKKKVSPLLAAMLSSAAQDTAMFMTRMVTISMMRMETAYESTTAAT